MTRIYLALGRFDRKRGQFYNALLGSPNGEQIVTDSFDVEFAACRALVARGVTGSLEVWHTGSEFAALRIRDIAKAASLTVREDERLVPSVVKYRPFPKKGNHAAQP